MSKQVLPQVFKKVDSINLNERHGAILAAGEIFLGLALEDPTLSLVGEFQLLPFFFSSYFDAVLKLNNKSNKFITMSELNCDQNYCNKRYTNRP